MASARRRHVEIAVRPDRFFLETGPAGLRPPNLRIHVFALVWVTFMVFCTHAVRAASIGKMAVLIPFWAAAIFVAVFAVKARLEDDAAGIDGGAGNTGLGLRAVASARRD